MKSTWSGNIELVLRVTLVIFVMSSSSGVAKAYWTWVSEPQCSPSPEYGQGAQNYCAIMATGGPTVGISARSSTNQTTGGASSQGNVYYDTISVQATAQVSNYQLYCSLYEAARSDGDYDLPPQTGNHCFTDSLWAEHY
jgi:hypothetical protein